MDYRFYDGTAAKKQLEELSKDRINAEFAPIHLATFTKKPDWRTEVQVALAGTPAAWRILCNEESGMEEIVFVVQGVLVNKDLPPVRFKTQTAKPTFLRQSIEICGMGSTTFEDAVKGIEDLDGTLARNVPEDTVDMQNIVGSFQGWKTIEVANRYFTSRTIARFEQTVDFEDGVDEDGRLAKLAGKSHVHTTENQVKYYQRRVSSSGHQSFSKIQPVVFKTGDIVEAKITVMMIEVGGKGKPKRHRSIGVLRSITLLDDSLTEDARRAVARKNMNTVLKRKADYDDEMEGEASAKMSRMHVSEEA